MRKGVLVAAVAAAAAAAASGVFSRRASGPTPVVSGDSVKQPADSAGMGVGDTGTAGTGPPVKPATAPGPASAVRSSLAGVYSDSQATAGSEVYAASCISCHGGMGNHVGPVFRTSWAGYTAADLLNYIYNSMPKDNPGSLSVKDYTAVIAYLFKLNGMPAGSTPLPADSDALTQIRIDTISTKPAGQ